MVTKFSKNPTRWLRGFTAAEMLIATAISGVVAGVAALTCYAVTLATTNYSQIELVQLPSGALNNFYPVNYPSTATRTRECLIAPNYSAVANAENMRERFASDTSKAVAVFALARNMGTYNTFRPSTITAPTTVLDTPEAFRAHLLTVNPTAAAAFVQYRNYPDTSVHCWSVFILGYSANTTTIRVEAVYDFDLLTATNPSTGTAIGYYASLRRYVNNGTTWNGQPSAYYEVVFPLSTVGIDQWSPSIVNFERQSRKAIVEGTPIDRFKIARQQPFFLLFWPDPSQPTLRLPYGNPAESTKPSLTNLSPAIPDTSPRKVYNHMCGRTSFMFSVPMFPSAL